MYYNDGVRQNVLKLILKSPRFVPFGANWTQFGWQKNHQSTKTEREAELFPFSVFLGEPNCTETDFKKYQICPIWGQLDPIRMPNLTSLLSMVKNKLMMQYTPTK